MTKDAALRLALEALEADELAMIQDKDGHMVYLKDQAITAIKAALEAKDEPWSPVSIGVDMTEAGAHVVGIYALDKDTSQIFYAKHHPAPQRTWVGLTDEEITQIIETGLNIRDSIETALDKLKEKNT